jgi:hypothetical protein
MKFGTRGDMQQIRLILILPILGMINKRVSVKCSLEAKIANISILTMTQMVNNRSSTNPAIYRCPYPKYNLKQRKKMVNTLNLTTAIIQECFFITINKELFPKKEV